MRCGAIRVSWLLAAMVGLWARPAPEVQAAGPQRQGGILPPSVSPALARSHARAVPLEELPPEIRSNVSRVLDQPTLFTRAPAEEFHGRPELYHWLLDHPDRAALAWRRLGAQCVEITDRGNGRFGWADGQGSNVYWDTIYRTPDVRIWYAEGVARPGPLLPGIAVKAVVVMHHSVRQDSAGQSWMWHQAEVFVQTDSKAAALLARMLGPSVPRVAEQAVAQLEMFFSALLGYCERHPEKAEKLLAAAAEPLKRE